MKFVRNLALPLAAIVALASPAAAQDAASEEMDQVMAQMGEMFPVVPLTAEEQSRLPAAQAIVARIMPDGTMGELMGSMFENFMGPMTKIATDNPSAAFAEILGFDPSEEGLSEEQAAEALALVDPAWRERREREAEIMPEIMTRVMRWNPSCAPQ